MARPAIAPPPCEVLGRLAGMRILVVGAGGSIGSALALRLAAQEPSALVLLDESETSLDALQRRWNRERAVAPAVFCLGSMADTALLDEIFALYAPQLVFHAAAFKNVPVLEGQPLAAIRNNIFGTLAVTRAAAGARILLLSTDKAVAPASLMGATKRVAERIVCAAGGTALRLGNVLASRGSVVEIFAGQIAEGGPLTVTAPAARRYFLTMDEAVNLLLASALEPESPALLAPKLPASHAIVDLARFMARELAPCRAIPIVVTGLRAGDKETEKFWSGKERSRPADSENLFCVESPPFDHRELHSGLARLRAALEARDCRASLSLLQGLVPDYTPSAALLALAGEDVPG